MRNYCHAGRATVLALVAAAAVAVPAAWPQSSPLSGMIGFRTPLTPNGGTFGRTLPAKLGDALSLLDFGAKCDGATDDSAAITAAMAAGGRIVIPSGMVCNGVSISQAGIASVFVGPGQIKTSDGNLRGPIVTQMSAPPVRLGVGNIVQAFNGDLSHVPLAIEARITGPNTLGQPASAYQFTNEASPVYLQLYNESGWNQSTGSSVTGRTGFAAFNLNVTQNGQGDAFGLFGNMIISGPNKTGGTSFLANPGGTLFGGQVYAGHAGVYLQGLGDINLNDSGYDVAGIGSTINLNRSVGTGALGATWIGHRVQSSGSVAADAAFSASGPFKMLLDAVDSPTSPVAAAAAGQRYYANAAQPSGVSFPGTVTLGGQYFDYASAGAWEFVDGSFALTFGGINNRFTAGAGQSNTGIGATALGSYSSVSGTYATVLGGAHQSTGNASTLMGQQAGDHGDTGATCEASGAFGSVQGSAQGCTYVLRASSSSTSVTRLTSDASAPSNVNCANIQPGTAMALDIVVMARDTVAPGNWSRWTLTGGVLARDTVTSWAAGLTPATQTASGTGTAAGLAAAADVANACLALSFTAPNADVWHVVATLRTAEDQ